MEPLVKEQPPSVEMAEVVAEATMAVEPTNPLLLVEIRKEVAVDLGI
jgi:hypothetical protein